MGAQNRLKKVTRTASGGGVTVEDYAYNALGALRVNAGVVLDDQRPRLSGGGTADAAVPGTLGGQPVVLDPGGRVTSLRGTTFGYDLNPWTVTSVTPPIPELPVTFGIDGEQRRMGEIRGGSSEFYFYEGMDRVATLDITGVKESYLFDGIDHPLRIKRGSQVVYYELDLAGNVRGLRLAGGGSLGGYRYTAFGKGVEDTTTFGQTLRWKGRWRQDFGGSEVYDVRARQWSPELGIFLSVDDYRYFAPNTTLWGWGHQSPARFTDPSGNDIYECTRWTWGFGPTSKGPLPHNYHCIVTPTFTSCYGHGGTPGADKFEQNVCRLISKGSVCLDECMLKMFLEAEHDYNVVWNNCYQWGERRLKACNKKCGIPDLASFPPR